MKTNKLTKFSKENKVKQLTTKQITKISGKGGGGIATTAIVSGIVVEEDLIYQ